jgi:hypothetical protein
MVDNKHRTQADGAKTSKTATKSRAKAKAGESASSGTEVSLPPTTPDADESSASTAIPDVSAPAAEPDVSASTAMPDATAPTASDEVDGDRELSVGTDAPYAESDEQAAPSAQPHVLGNISEVRHFFRTNTVPIYFVGASPFNLLGLDRWVRNLSYIAYYDGWDGAHPRIFTPQYKPYTEFASGEEINNWLLRNPEVRARMTRGLEPGVRPKVVMVFFNEETEAICRELGYDLILPSAQLRERLDSKIVTTKLGNSAGVASVPNIVTKTSTYKTLRSRAEKAGLGDDLVVQTAYGDSGKTTFFISAEEDWNSHRDEIAGQQIKVMRRINPLSIAVEAVITSSGTVVGPFLTELTGYPELTPYEGGWCGNEMLPDVLTGERRTKATDLVRRLGDQLGKEGYRGFFEVDVLTDLDSDNVYLGELNPRISGASAITNVTAGAYADVPLFLFHLLEFLDVDFDLDVDEINERWQRLSGSDAWSQMVIKETAQITDQLTATPLTGQYYLDDAGALVFRRAALDWHQLQNDSEVFYLRIYGVGDYRWKGADLGVLVTKGRLQTDAGRSVALSIRGKHFIDSIRAQYVGIPVPGSTGAPTTGIKSG